MQVLTPIGYRDPSTLSVGEEVCAFDIATGAPIINTIEGIDFVDYDKWCQIWSVDDEVPEFTWYRINGGTVLFREQSVWRNGANVCHARDLTVGDVIHDNNDADVTISSIDAFEDRGLTFYRFDISGDHSYIIDDITVHNAGRFWVGGTGTWDASTTTHWAASTNAAGGASVPGSADTVTFDFNSDLVAGAHTTCTVTVNTTVNVTSLTMGTFGATGGAVGGSGTGILDFSANNNNVTLQTFSGSGSGTRTLNMGNGTWTLTGTGSVWNNSTITNFTLNANSSIVTFTATSATQRTFTGGSTLTYNTINASANTSGGPFALNGSTTITTLNVTAPNCITFSGGSTTTIGTLSAPGSSGSEILLSSASIGTSATISVASNAPSLSWAGIRDMTCSGGATFAATNSFDLGHNSGITITAPSGGGMKYTNDMGGNLG